MIGILAGLDKFLYSNEAEPIIFASPKGYRKSNTPLTIALDSRYVTQWLVDSVANLTKAYVPQLTIGYNSGCCSDQQSFYEQGFPAMGCVVLFLRAGRPMKRKVLLVA